MGAKLVDHWSPSALKHRLIANNRYPGPRTSFDDVRTADESRLLVSKSLMLCLAYVKASVVAGAARNLFYDHLVAYVVEVLRLAIQGHWEVNTPIGNPIRIWWEGRCMIPHA